MMTFSRPLVHVDLGTGMGYWSLGRERGDLTSPAAGRKDGRTDGRDVLHCLPTWVSEFRGGVVCPDSIHAVQ